MELSKTNKELIRIYELGYRVSEGIVYNPSGSILHCHIKENGYMQFHPSKHGQHIMVHRLVAYQKYGNLIFQKDIEVRHLDGNSLNNLEENICVGNHQENMMDIHPDVRQKNSIKASKKIRKFTNEEVKQIRSLYLKTRSYKLVMQEWNITSKGTLHYIINNNYVT